MMKVNHEKKLIFIHIPKCAGGSITQTLDLKFHDGCEPHMGASCSREKCDFWHDYTKFAIVRNPWEAALSLFFFRLSRNFIEVLDEHLKMKHQPIHLASAAGGFKYDIKKPLVNWHWLSKKKDRIRQINHRPAVNKHFRFPPDCLKYPQSMMRYLTSNKDTNKFMVNRIIRFENLEGELKDFTESVGVSYQELQHNNQTSHLHYSKYYTEQWMIDYIYDTHKDYIKHFNYEFETES